MKPIKIIIAAVVGSLLWTGCASFTTTQTDERLNEKTGEKTTVTTKATARTLFDAKSELAKFKASQTDKSQTASVGSINQETSGTNVNALAESIARGIVTGIK